jgi:hypothetical protein
MFQVFKVHSPDGVNFYKAQTRRLIVSPDGRVAVWLHPLDLTTPHFPQYDKWVDVTVMGDDEFEALVRQLQTSSRKVAP